MVKFDEQKQIDSVNGALALRPQIEELIDRLLAEGVKNLCWLGIGGTWASCMQVVCYLKEHTDMDTFATNAAEYCTTGDKRVGAGTLVVLSSVTGTTTEIVWPRATAQRCWGSLTSRMLSWPLWWITASATRAMNS